MKKFMLLLVMLFLSSAQAVGEDLEDQRELNYWADWSDGGEQNQEKLPFSFEHFLQRIARRPRPQQFYGLMGKRDAGYSPVSHKRYKTDSFVGLMGKRSLNSVMKASLLSIYENQRNDLLNGVPCKCLKEDANETVSHCPLKCLSSQLSVMKNSHCKEYLFIYLFIFKMKIIITIISSIVAVMYALYVMSRFTVTFLNGI